MTKYYVRTNEGAYLQGHANPTPLWTNKVEDSEQLSLMEATNVINHNKDKLKSGVELFIEDMGVEGLKAELKRNDRLHWSFDKVDASAKIPDTNVDDVNHPEHYTQYTFEAIDIIDEVAPKYPIEVAVEIGNAIKYLLRAPFKGRLIQDLNKAVWYINRAIDNLEKSEKYDYED